MAMTNWRIAGDDVNLVPGAPSLEKLKTQKSVLTSKSYGVRRQAKRDAALARTLAGKVKSGVALRLPPHSIAFVRCLGFFLISSFTPLGADAASNDLTGLMQKALFEEEGNHNLPAAIEAYQSIITKSDDMRAVTATVLFRLGECYRKQRKTNEAVAQYQRILREFSDQTTLATLSEQNLGALGAPVMARSDKPANDSAAWQKRLTEIKKMPKEEQRVAVQQLAPNRVLDTLMEKLMAEQQALVAAKTDYGPTHPEIQKRTALIEVIEKQIDTQVESTLHNLQESPDLTRFLA